MYETRSWKKYNKQHSPHGDFDITTVGRKLTFHQINTYARVHTLSVNT